ncbi:hypothetical protein OROMI_010651 [Orobanche minor]
MFFPNTSYSHRLIMASIHIHRGFGYLFTKNSSLLCEPRVYLSVYFSTSRNEQPPQKNPNFPKYLVQKYNFHPQTASYLASVLTTFRTPQNSDTILSFFVESGFSAAQLEKIVKSWPKLLAVNIDKIIKPKFKIFQDFGLSTNEIIDIISKEPSILHSSADKKVIPSLSVLKGLLGSTAEVAKILKVSGWFIRSDLDKNLVPNVGLLTSCGVDMDNIVRLMYYIPRMMLQKPEKFRKIVEKADQMGADRNSKMFIHAVRVVGSMSDERLELKLKAFRDVGFSEHDILRAFRTSPLVFSVSVEKMKKVKEIVLGTGKYDISCILNCPTSFNRSIEKKFKPRIAVLKTLEGNNLIRKWPPFSSTFQFTDKKFFDKFVCPYYAEVGEVFKSMTGFSGKREV